MRLTLHTDYALRILLYLGMNPDRRVSIHEIAERHVISENHLVKVVHRLGRKGFITTIRGRNGGLVLSRAAKTIVIGDVVRATEEDMAIVGCFEGGQGCIMSDVCTLQTVLGDAMDAFMAVLDDRTLADLLTPPEGSALAARFVSFLNRE